MTSHNDMRGWVMTAISGVACVFGASIIHADLIVRLLPGQKHFRIQDSDAFLSASLSLSAGVMLFSALYTILPESRESLTSGGYSPSAASWILLACFSGGIIGIQLISNFLHRYMPSHAVDCDHSHDEDDEHDHHHDQHSHNHETIKDHQHGHRSASAASHDVHHTHDEIPDSTTLEPQDSFHTARSQRMPLPDRIYSTLSLISPSVRQECDLQGPCRGFSEPCSDDCFKFVQARADRNTRTRSLRRMLRSPLGRSATMPFPSASDETVPLIREPRGRKSLSTDTFQAANHSPRAIYGTDSTTTVDEEAQSSSSVHKSPSSSSLGQKHHHHVPQNAFLALGLQTSIAIALHKLPEGFITFATNHANPELGFTVFLALCVHNITEGFALALPLYLAFNSRWKAMMCALVLGGFSQPIGAGVAAAWFKLAGSGSRAPGEGVYGAMFAVTSGIMTSVALQLFGESLDLSHNRDICKLFAFLGMAILGMTSALTAV